MRIPKNCLPFLVCLAVVLVWFSPWWIGGKVLAPLDLQNRMMCPWRGSNETQFAKNHIVSDGVDQYLVYRMIAEKAYREEGRVGWSSLTYGGTAQNANTMALYYDWTMQLHRWFGFWTAWHLGLMGQVLLAAWGMLLFLRGRSISPLWACCGALAYAANSQFVTWIYHRWALGSFCWVPWILWAIDGYRDGRRFTWGLVPVFIGMAFLGGTLQHAALVVLAVAAMWLEEAIKAGRGGGLIQSRIFGRYVAWGMLGAGLAGMMLLPCADAFLTSNRLGLHTGMTTNASNSIYPQGPLQPLFNLTAYPFQIFPSILGRCDAMDVLKLFKSELFYVAYFGSLPVLIAFLAVWRRSTPLAARLLIGCGLLLPLTPLVRIFYQRLFLLFILGGILAFAHFLETSARETRLRVFRVTSIVFGIAIAGWSVLSLALLGQAQLLASLREKILTEAKGSSFGFFSGWLARRADHFIGDLFIWSPQQLLPLLLAGAALCGLRWTASIDGMWRKRGGFVVALAVILEVSLFGSRWIVWADPAKSPLFTETLESNALQEHVGRNGRVTTLIHPTAHMAMTPFIPNTLAAYGIAADNGYDSIIPDGMLLPGESAGDARILGRCGVSHLITWPANTDVSLEWKPVWRSPSMALYENTLALPRYLAFRTDEEKKQFFRGAMPDFLEIRENSGKENSRILDIPAGAKWIRIAENHADGWKYRSDSSEKWLPVQRAADASMIFENPDPEHATRFEMCYAPALRIWGMVISVASLFLTILATCFRFRKPGSTITPA